MLYVLLLIKTFDEMIKAFQFIGIILVLLDKYLKFFSFFLLNLRNIFN